MIEISQSTGETLGELLCWLQREQAECGEGLFCNKDIIVESHAAGELHCAISNGQVVGFVVHTATDARASIDILEVHPRHRRRGIGTKLAVHAIKQLHASPAPFIQVQCSPRSSEPFWRLLGFSSSQASTASGVWAPVGLILPNVA